MTVFDDRSLDLDLKCDFPARASFREALLERLKATEAHEAPSDAELSEGDLEMRELADDELEVLYAARGDAYAKAQADALAALEEKLGITGKKHNY